MHAEIEPSVYLLIDYKRRKCTPRILPFSIFVEYVCLHAQFSATIPDSPHKPYVVGNEIFV